MDDDIDKLQAAIDALQRQRPALGDDAVELAVAALRAQQAGLAPRTPAQPQQQLRQVTVLFADVVGSTALIRDLDPEAVHTLMDGALVRLAEIVRAHRGVVLQYAGDSLLAVFGTPVSHEDDAERAVRAGLAMLAEGRALSARVPAGPGGDFEVRVGLNTGPVLLGGGVDGDNSIRGLTVNIAARMEQSAPAGGVRISQSTWRQVRGRFELQAQPPLQVKGHDAPMQTYLVQGVRRSEDGLAGRGVTGVATPLVGRGRQLQRLQQADAALRAQGGLHGVLLVGDAGLGKSRLVAEFRRWAQAQPGGLCWLQALAGEPSTGRPYGQLRALLAGAVGFVDDEPAPRARERWLAGATPLLHDAADAALLGHLLGLDFSSHAEVRALAGDARQLRDRAFFHASQLLRALAARAGPARPLVALFDDLHWADDGTLDFIAHLAAAHADLPLLLLGLTRPTLAERRPDWRPPGQRIDVPPLDEPSAGELADALLAPLGTVPPGLRELVTAGGEGIPFHMEELVNMLLDQGVVVAGVEGWVFHADRLQALKVPGTLVGVLQARLDALPAALRRAAQVASALGFRLREDGLQALGLAPGDVQGLLARELLVRPHAPGAAGVREVSFRHQTLHQVVYDSLLRRDRRGLHAQAARWLLGLDGETAHDQVAEHFERGGEPMLALQHWTQAAETAASRFANAQALANAERALALVPADDLARRFALTSLRVRALHTMSERARHAAELDALQALALAAGNPVWSTEALTRRARWHYDGGDVVQALALAQRAATQLPEDAPLEGARVFALLAPCLSRLGRRDEAGLAAGRALQLARQAGSLADEGTILNDMGMRADEGGDHGAALALYARALACHRTVGHRSNEGGTLSNLGYAAMMLGDYEAAGERFRAAREIFARIGHRQNEGITLVNLGMAQFNQGRVAEAREHAQQAQALLQQAGDRWSEAAALRLLGQTALALGEHDAAQRPLEASHRTFDDLAMHDLAMEPMAALALLALQRGDLPLAQGWIEQVLVRQANGTRLDGCEEPMGVHLACFRVLEAAGDARARGVLAAACRTLNERAARIADLAARQHYLQRVPRHRELLAAWHAQPG